MKRFQNSKKLVYGKFYVHEIAPVDLSKSYFLKNAKKACKPNNHYFKSRLSKSSRKATGLCDRQKASSLLLINSKNCLMGYA